MKFLLVVAFLATAALALDDAEIAEFFNLDDVNRDGKIEESEIVGQFANLDVNMDGMVDASEILAIDIQTQTETEAQVILRTFDVNKDGKVNVTDFIKSFKMMDANNDGSVDIFEYAATARFYPGRSEVILLANGAEGIGLFFASVDTDKDGQLSPAEMKAIFDGMDTTGDGKVDLAEFKEGFGKTFQQNDNETTIMFNEIDSSDDGLIDDAERDALFAKNDLDGSGGLSSVEFIGGLLEAFRDIKIRLAIGGAQVASVDEEIQKLIDRGVGFLFTARDADKDGFVTSAEEKASIMMADANGDGVLTEAEAVPAIAKGLRLRESVATIIFKGLDSDENGTFDDADLAEFMKIADNDGDGKLNMAEFKAATVAMVTMGRMVDSGAITFEQAGEILQAADGLARLFETYDTDGDFVVSVAEFDSEVLQKLDLTGDKKLTMLEFLPRFATTFSLSMPEAAEMFRRIDANGDKMIDEAEGHNFFNKFDMNGDSTVTNYEFTATVLREVTQVRSLVGIQAAADVFG